MSEFKSKAAEAAPVTDEQLERIHRYSRRELGAEEVFVFPVVLCDNEVDRDLERFPTESLEVLAGLFLGKTGVFDHKPTSENQSARVFDAAVETEETVNSAGEPYAQVKAWAYMLRSDKNADLIREIDAGIKKEVSVSCEVERTLCSVCGQDQRAGACSHRKGEMYDGAVCHHLLVDPADAFEWSFVGVPAQKNAGVIKRRGDAADTAVVSKGQLGQLERLAELGQRYESGLRERVVKLGLLGHRDLSREDWQGIAARLDAPQLEALEKSFRRSAEERYPLRPQLAGGREETEPGDSGAEFQIK